MRERLLRSLQGLRPYAAVKTLAASQLADGGYPKTRRNYFEGTAEVAVLDARDEIKYVAASAAAEAVEDLSLRLDVERWMPL